MIFWYSVCYLLIMISPHIMHLLSTNWLQYLLVFTGTTHCIVSGLYRLHHSGPTMFT